MANLVGGSTVHYGAQSWRFRVDDFKIRSATVEKYGKRALPAGAVVRDWPLSYKDLEPYYDNVEYLIGVSGKGGANPFEGPRSREFPMPPLRAEGFATKDKENWRLLVFERDQGAKENATEGLTGYVGVALRVDKDRKEIAVGAVLDGSPAKKAGLRKDDIVLKIGGQEVKELLPAVEVVRQTKPGMQLVFRVSRDGKESDITITTGVVPFTWLAFLE